MIPLKDTIPKIGFPLITWTLILVNGAIFIFEISLPKDVMEKFFYLFGLVPARYSHPNWAVLHGLSFDDYLSFLTNMFLHGGWLHIIGNMWFLHLFGSSEEHAVLGPVDPQIGEYPAASLVRLAENKPISDIDDKSWILADMGKKAIEQIRAQVKSLLGGKYSTEKAEELARILTEGRWTHDYPLTFEEASALGLHVAKGIPPELYQLISLYPQPVRHQPRWNTSHSRGSKGRLKNLEKL